LNLEPNDRSVQRGWEACRIVAAFRKPHSGRAFLPHGGAGVAAVPLPVAKQAGLRLVSRGARRSERLGEIIPLPDGSSMIRIRDLCWLAVAPALLLAGCNSEWLQERARFERATTTPPVSYKSDIVAFMRTYLNDPTGVRGAFVTEPALRTLDNVERYMVCLRYTARKSGGQYAASKDSIVLFRDGRLDRIIDNGREQCKDAAYRPFPELEQLSR
jgi:hypothetical protein